MSFTSRIDDRYGTKTTYNTDWETGALFVDADDPVTAAWTISTFNGIVDEVATAIEGQPGRNITLYNAAIKAHIKLIQNQLIPEQQVTDALYNAAHDCGLHTDRQCGPEGIRKTISSGYAAARKIGPQPVPSVKDPNVSEVPLDTFNIPQLIEVGAESAIDAQQFWGNHPPIPAAEFLFGTADELHALWGEGDDVLWVEGEAFMICGGMGLGKTTLAGQLLRAQLLGGDVLGLPVTQTEGTILYLAMDRPRQIRRSLLRQFDESHQQELQRLLIRPGPPMADMAAQPTLLVAMAELAGADIVYVDSLKDAAIGLSDDKVGAGYNRARQHLLAAGKQICELHHNRKTVQGNTPGSISEVYGSTWISAGAGSIINLTGDPGDPIIGFRHVKQALNQLGPWKLNVDHEGGRMTIDHEVDLIELASSSPDGITVEGAARAIFDSERPTPANKEAARRKLTKLAEAGLLRCHEGARGRGASAWFPALRVVESNHADWTNRD